MYITDVSRIIANNVADIFGGTSVQSRYIEMIQNSKTKETADEIIERIKEGINELI